METKTLTVTESQLANTTINEQLIKELYHVNYLVPYPLSDLMLEGWARCILELSPKTTAEDIKKIINKMKVGDLAYDSKKGVQNIFLAIAQFNRKVFN